MLHLTIMQIAWLAFVALLTWLFHDPAYLGLLIFMIFFLPRNPRKKRMEKKLDELAESLEDIRQATIKTP